MTDPTDREPRQPDPPVRLVLAGAGSRGAVWSQLLAARRERARLMAVADPDPERRARIAAVHGIPPEACFPDAAALFSAPRPGEGAIVATPDRHHAEPALAALAAGYEVLLEKPAACEAAGLDALEVAARARPGAVSVAMVLRYAPFFRTLHAAVARGRIGRLATILWSEDVGWWHFAHSFVRGPYAREAESAPMLLAKACHDLDLILGLAGAPCTRVSSRGGLGFFRPESAPAGAPARCTDGCAAEPACAFSAPRFYLETMAGRQGWPLDVLGPDPTRHQEALATGPYGRCVYRAGNDVADHQTVDLEFANRVRATLVVSALSADVTRRIRLQGSEGELEADFARGQLRLTRFGDPAPELLPVAGAGGGHGGGDEGLLGAFLARVRAWRDGVSAPRLPCALEEALASHRVALAAELSRREGRAIGLA